MMRKSSINYVNLKLDIGRIKLDSHDIWCRKVTKVYISCRKQAVICFFGCISIMDKFAPCFDRNFSSFCGVLLPVVPLTF